MRPLRLLLAGLVFAGAPAATQTIVASPHPDGVAVTVYRDPERAAHISPDLEWLKGYALISETRTIELPVGESEIRFEGVAAGLVPQSAIVTGLPEGIIERNRDAYLLSPATLLDRSLGRRVTIRRTSHATGVVRETEAVIRSGAQGGVVLQTPDGFEALRCTGQSEGLVYSEVPADLSARPTLSVRARSSRAITARVTLSYLASGFDWEANYIANLSDDGQHVELFAWLTLASNDETSFPNADTQAVAGRLNRERTEPQPREGGPLTLQCWPHQSTSDIPLEEFVRLSMPGEDLEVTGSAMYESAMAVTAISAEIIASQEDLGDLKLYRIPEPVTVAANSQKQVAFLARSNVLVGFVYRGSVARTDIAEHDSFAMRYLVTRNREDEGLGIPLPAGNLILFSSGERPLLLGEGTVYDAAIGQDIEIYLSRADGVHTRLVRESRRGKFDTFRYEVTNDQAQPIRFEALFQEYQRSVRSQTRLSRRHGLPLWTITVPANGTATLRFRLRNDDD